MYMSFRVKIIGKFGKISWFEFFMIIMYSRRLKRNLCSCISLFFSVLRLICLFAFHLNPFEVRSLFNSNVCSIRWILKPLRNHQKERKKKKTAIKSFDFQSWILNIWYDVSTVSIHFSACSCVLGKKKLKTILWRDKRNRKSFVYVTNSKIQRNNKSVKIMFH